MNYRNDVTYKLLHSKILTLCDGTLYYLCLCDHSNVKIRVSYFDFKAFLDFTISPYKLLALYDTLLCAKFSDFIF